MLRSAATIVRSAASAWAPPVMARSVRCRAWLACAIITEPAATTTPTSDTTAINSISVKPLGCLWVIGAVIPNLPSGCPPPAIPAGP